jgi:Phage late-transcription coactivator
MKKKVTKPNLEEMEKFSNNILKIVERDKLDYIEAITEYSEEIGLELDIAASLITPFLKDKISEEARRNNLIEKTPVLYI